MASPVTRAEWRWAMLVAALILALISLPYLVGVAAQTQQWHFGGFLLGVDDGYSYIAKMGQGARGEWLFRLPYSSEPQNGALIFLFYLLLGKLAGPEYTAQVLVFHVARLVFGWAMLLASYRFLAEFLPEIAQRRLGLILLAFGGGLGWLLVLSGFSEWFGSYPVDFISPEAFSFITLYSLPHIAFSRIFLILALLAYLRRSGLQAGLCLIMVGLIQPLYVGTAWAVMGVDTFFTIIRFWNRHAERSRSMRALFMELRPAALAGLLSAPTVAYALFSFNADPFLKQWLAQNTLPSPHPLHYVAAYGVWLLIGYFGWRALLKHEARLAWFCAAWLIIQPVLLYAPISTQRRLIEGIHLPLTVLAVWGLTVALMRWRRWLVPAMLGVSSATSALLLAGGAASALSLARPVFLPADQLAAFMWLKHNASAHDVGLSAFDTGNTLPAFTPLTAYIGHGPETVFLSQKLPRVEAFYQSTTPEGERRQLLTDGRITFVLAGPLERALGDFDLGSAAYLTKRFEQGEYAVYQVVP